MHLNSLIFLLSEDAELVGKGEYEHICVFRSMCALRPLVEHKSGNHDSFFKNTFIDYLEFSPYAHRSCSPPSLPMSASLPLWFSSTSFKRKKKTKSILCGLNINYSMVEFLVGSLPALLQGKMNLSLPTSTTEAISWGKSHVVAGVSQVLWAGDRQGQLSWAHTLLPFFTPNPQAQRGTCLGTTISKESFVVMEIKSASLLTLYCPIRCYTSVLILLSFLGF